MNGNDLLEVSTWKLPWIGINHPFFNVNIETVITTWLIIGLLFVVAYPVRWLLQRKDGFGRYIILNFITSFMEMCEQALGPHCTFDHFSFITTIFIFIFISNTIIFIPWMTEPTKDLNTTLALGLISFIYTQTYSIKMHGFKEYLKEFTTPIFIMFPLHVLGKISSVISISFRLFGNIFGGSIISHMYLSMIEGSIILETLGLLSGLNFGILLAFGLFEGFLQAFVFTMLSLTYLGIAIQLEPEEQL